MPALSIITWFEPFPRTGNALPFGALHQMLGVFITELVNQQLPLAVLPVHSVPEFPKPLLSL
eukprot:920531-Prorocentrum_lima.AAC.1